MFRPRHGAMLLGIGWMAASLTAATSAATRRVPQDYTTIQAAIDAAQAEDTVVVGPGTYKERIRLKPGITVASSGDGAKGKLGLLRAETTIIDGRGNEGQGAGVVMAEGAALDGFTVTNVGKYDEAQWQEHHATQGEHQPHEQIGKPGTAGISAEGVSCTITNNIVHHIGYSGIAIQGVEGKQCAPHVCHNICYRNMGGGIASMQESTALIEANVCFQNFYAGIGHNDASPTVLNNVCFENIRAGIGISEGSCPIVRGNKCYQNRRAGIGIRTGGQTRPILEENECYGNEMAGIGVRDKAAPIIQKNRCYSNKLAGIGARDHATPTIIGNECYENEKAGIGQQGDAVTTLIGNHCHHNKAAGIGFESCTEGRSTVVGNRVIDNALVAVGIHSGWNVRMSGNEFSREGGLPPMVMVFEGADATLEGNRIRGGGVAGIRVAGTVRAFNNDIIGTSLRKSGPPNFAIWALPGADVTMTDNRVRGWRHALQATEATIVACRNTVSDFHQAAFVVQKAKRPARVHGNTAFSSNPQDKVVIADGEADEVTNNELKVRAGKRAP